MMEKGFSGKIECSDDLYDLPDTMECKYISAKFDQQFEKAKLQETGK